MSASVIESSLTLKRIYEVPVARLWRAWTESAELGQWYVAGSDHIVHFCEADVRVGGAYRVGFGPPDRKPYVETGRYTEVVPPSRLVFEETVSNSEGEHIHTHMTVVEFRDLGDNKSQLILTSLGPESWRTGEGWTPALESLSAHLVKTSLNREDRMTNPDNSVLKVRRSIYIAAPPSRIWQEFISKPRMDGWWGKIRSTPVAGQPNGQHLRTYEPQLGGRIEMEVDMGGSPARYGGTIKTFDPGKEFTFENDWLPKQKGWKAPTYMTVRLTPALKGTLVELFHYGFEHTGGDVAGEHAGYEQGWGMLQLTSLKAVVEGKA